MYCGSFSSILFSAICTSGSDIFGLSIGLFLLPALLTLAQLLRLWKETKRGPEKALEEKGAWTGGGGGG